MSFSRRATAVLAALALLPALVAVQAATTTQEATAATSLLRPADGVYRATIRRTEHGIPHITARDYGSLGFGHGFATAETSICSLADTLLTARGERSRYLGANRRYRDHVTLDATNRQTDTLFTDIRNRRVVERLLADPRRGPSQETKAIVRGYTAGINRYLRSVGGSPGIEDPACRGAAWIRPTATPLDLWYGVYAANLLASTGVFVPQIADAAPPTADDPGLPATGTASFAEVPRSLPSRDDLLAGLGKDPRAPFGSNATAVGADSTATGHGMLLGNPHFPWRGRYRFTQSHLTIPGEYDVAGASLIGSPVVNIGFNDDVAWSHTVSTAYRFTPYEYRTVPGAPTTYLTEAGPRTCGVARCRSRPRGGRPAAHGHRGRLPHRPGLRAPRPGRADAVVAGELLRDPRRQRRAPAHDRHVPRDGEGAQRPAAARSRGPRAGMPWVNTIAADRAGNVLYADHSVVPNVPDEVVARCLTPVGAALFELAGLPGLDGTRASGDCAWRTDADASRPGVFGPGNLPETFRRDWVVNANDSYWLPNPEQRLEGYDRIIGCERCERSLRTRMVYRYVMDRLAGRDGLAADRRVSHRTLRLFEHENRVFGAELARRDGDLHEVCLAADGGRACDVLTTWDGRSDTGSVGTHVFQEFWKRVPAELLWEVPFDPPTRSAPRAT